MRLRGVAGAGRAGRGERASNLFCRNRAGIALLGKPPGWRVGWAILDVRGGLGSIADGFSRTLNGRMAVPTRWAVKPYESQTRTGFY